MNSQVKDHSKGIMSVMPTIKQKGSSISIKKIKFKSDILKKNITLKVSNAALRTVDFKGGIDKFLSSAKAFKLSKRAKKYRNKIVLKEA